MARFTYTGVDGAADPNGTRQFGIDFPVNKSVEVTDEKAIAKLAGHPHFKASDKDGKKAEKAASDANPPPPEEPKVDDRAYNKGAEAAAAGKGRSVPPAYRGKGEEAQWLAGYDAGQAPASGQED
jgi:hypothetical protein